MTLQVQSRQSMIVIFLTLTLIHHSIGLTSHTRRLSANPGIVKKTSDRKLPIRKFSIPPYLDALTTREHFDSKSRLNSFNEPMGHEDALETIATKDNHKTILISSAVAYLGSTVVLTKTGIMGPYSPALLARDIGATVFCTVFALIFVKSITTLAAENVLQPRDSRKLIHTFSAPLFILTWPLFSNLWGSRIFAAFVPLLQAIKLYLAAKNKGGSEERELAGAISRSGDSSEVLGGPFIYVVILFSVIVTVFMDNLSGIMALSAMAVGDGLADIVGRRFGKTNKWKFCPDKSIAGSLAFFAGSSLSSLGLAAWLRYTGSIVTTTSLSALAPKFILISAISTIIELLPIGDDNWSVPICAGALSMALLS